MAEQLQNHYPWTQSPLIANGPMRLITHSELAIQVSHAGGLGFIGAGNDASILPTEFEKAKKLQSQSSTLRSIPDVLPIGVGFLLWAGEKLLQEALPSIEKYVPAAVWFFAPSNPDQLVQWTTSVRRVTQGKTKIWIQTCTVQESLRALQLCSPDVLVVQGIDAGGHGLLHGSGVLPLFPEVHDAIYSFCTTHHLPIPAMLAAGGISDSRTTAAALALGAEGVVMGTRYLASPEAILSKGYQNAVLQATDGGVSTARGKLYDSLRGTTDWPDEYGGRGVLNQSWWDHVNKGMGLEENKRLYEEALKKGDEGWGEQGRLTTYAGTGVGLVREVKGAAEITEEVREGAKAVLRKMVSKL